MATLAVTNTFVDATAAEAAEVNENFDDVVGFVNTQVIHRDASIAFTAIPTGPTSDATTANQFVRKAMLDSEASTRAAADTSEASTRAAADTALALAANSRTVTYARKPSDQASISTIAAVISPSASSMSSGRRYKFTIELSLLMSTTTAEYAVYLRNVGDGLTYRRWQIAPPLVSPFVFDFVHVTEESVSGGSQTWRVDVERIGGGSSTLTVYGNPNEDSHITPSSAPRYSSLLIEDIGSL